MTDKKIYKVLIYEYGIYTWELKPLIEIKMGQKFREFLDRKSLKDDNYMEFIADCNAFLNIEGIETIEASEIPKESIRFLIKENKNE